MSAFHLRNVLIVGKQTNMSSYIFTQRTPDPSPLYLSTPNCHVQTHIPTSIYMLPQKPCFSQTSVHISQPPSLQPRAVLQTETSNPTQPNPACPSIPTPAPTPQAESPASIASSRAYPSEPRRRICPAEHLSRPHLLPTWNLAR